MFLMQLVRKFLGDEKVRQSIMLLTTSVAIMPLTLAINYFLTKLLGKEGFGDFSLVTNVFVFLQVVFNFGFFYSAGRLLAISAAGILWGWYICSVCVIFNSIHHNVCPH